MAAVVVSVKLQELFGLAETPRLGPALVPVTFELLAPNGRPVQTTQDLKSFWERTYPEVRKELRGRYPRHPWPEDPASTQGHAPDDQGCGASGRVAARAVAVQNWNRTPSRSSRGFMISSGWLKPVFPWR